MSKVEPLKKRESGEPEEATDIMLTLSLTPLRETTDAERKAGSSQHVRVDAPALKAVVTMPAAGVKGDSLSAALDSLCLAIMSQCGFVSGQRPNDYWVKLLDRG